MADETESTYTLLANQDSESVDSYGLYSTSLNFTWDDSPGDGSTIEVLATGSLGIVLEEFEDIYGNEVQLYLSVGVDDPTFSLADYEQGGAAYYTITYSDEEEAGLRAKFGGDYEHPANSDDAKEITNNLVESYINAAVEELVTTTLKPQFSFKKVRYEELDYDNLSTFEETEATQAAATSLVQTTEGTY